MRNAVELYYHQHNAAYPGAKKYTDGTASPRRLSGHGVRQSADALQRGDREDQHHQDRHVQVRAVPEEGRPAQPVQRAGDHQDDIATTDISAATSSGPRLEVLREDGG